jgi:hypothetical protein
MEMGFNRQKKVSRLAKKNPPKMIPFKEILQYVHPSGLSPLQAASKVGARQRSPGGQGIDHGCEEQLSAWRNLRSSPG